MPKQPNASASAENRLPKITNGDEGKTCPNAPWVKRYADFRRESTQSRTLLEELNRAERLESLRSTKRTRDNEEAAFPRKKGFCL